MSINSFDFNLWPGLKYFCEYIGKRYKALLRYFFLYKIVNRASLNIKISYYLIKIKTIILDHFMCKSYLRTFKYVLSMQKCALGLTYRSISLSFCRFSSLSSFAFFTALALFESFSLMKCRKNKSSFCCFYFKFCKFNPVSLN